MNRPTSISVDSPSKLPHQEHWAILSGSSVSHAEEGVWAPGHGYPAYTEYVIEYRAYLNEEEFKSELQRELSSEYGRKVIGIHVDKIYTKKSLVDIVETKLSNKE